MRPKISVEQVTASNTEDEASTEGNSVSSERDQQVEEDEEEMECGFCIFMKGGGCRENFVAWEKCVEDAEKNKEDIVEKCFEVTALLKKCMEAHADYYEPILRAEKAMEEEAKEELDQERAAASNSQGTSQGSEHKGSTNSPAVDETQGKKEPNQDNATANDSQTASRGPVQEGPSKSPAIEKK